MASINFSTNLKWVFVTKRLECPFVSHGQELLVASQQHWYLPREVQLHFQLWTIRDRVPVPPNEQIKILF